MTSAPTHGIVNRRSLDIVVAAFVIGILLVGGGLTWENYRQAQVHGEMMGGMGGVHGPDPVWYLLGTLLVAGFVAVGYLVIRDQLADDATSVESNAASHTTTPAESVTADSITDDVPTTNPPNETEPDDSSVAIGTNSSEPIDSKPGDAVETSNEDEREVAHAPTDVTPRPRILDILPDDERRILEPVLESPGLTQIELRDRSDFSKSKVSQTVTDLEKRGLLYREPQGRTYRIYPSDDFEPERDHRQRG